MVEYIVRRAMYIAIALMFISIVLAVFEKYIASILALLSGLALLSFASRYLEGSKK